MSAVSFDRYETVWLKQATEQRTNIVDEDYEDDEDVKCCPLDKCPLCASHNLDDSCVATRPFGANGYVPHVNDVDDDDDEGCQNNANNAPATVPLCVLGEVQLRFLCPDDLEEVRALCQDWFPIGMYYIQLWSCFTHVRCTKLPTFTVFQIYFSIYIFSLIFDQNHIL